MFGHISKRWSHFRKLPYLDTADLAFQKTAPKSYSKLLVDNSPVFLNIHGILGSKAMFRSIDKALVENFNSDVYSIDLRNHGASPRAFPYDYITLTKDIIKFIQTHIGPDRPVNITGFSAGGKLGLLSTLSDHVNINKCISVDLPPYYTPELDSILMDNYDLIMKILRKDIEIRKDSPCWKKQVSELFKNLSVNDPNTTALYFSNGFLSNPNNNNNNNNNGQAINDWGDMHIKYSIPLEGMPNFIDEVKAWPDLNSKSIQSEGLFKSRTEKSILLLRGIKSDFIGNNIDMIKPTFPNSSVHAFDSGHNILFEKSKEATEVIVDFFRD